MKENTPLSFVTIPFIIGIIIGYNLSIPTKVAFLISILTALAASIEYHITKINRHKGKKLLLAMIFISFLSLGIYRISFSPYSKPNLYSKLLKESVNHKKTLIIKNIANIERNYSTIECLSLIENEILILYLKNNKATINYLIGDTIILFSRINPIKNYTKKFNYKEYKASQRCFSYAFADLSNHIHIKTTKPNIADKFSRLRNRHIQQIRKELSYEEWGDILIAIITGEKEHLAQDSLSRFQSSGIIHLMAVSGLHTGLIYSYIIVLLFFLGNNKYIRIAKLLTAITITWLYCAYTGFSDSSIRAAIMISFLSISKISCGKYQFLNSLYASALITLIIKPHTIMSIGFQLSYLSILSIYYIHPAIHSHFISTNKLKKIISQLISISLSCQLGTSIITIPKFGYIPLYFLIGNLICSPLSAIAIFMSGIWLLSGINSEISHTITFIIKKTINIIQLSTETISIMPLAVIRTETTKSIITALMTTIAITYIFITGKKSNGRSNQ